MEFLLLGPVEVRDGRRRLAVGGPQAVKALAALLLAGGRVVGLDELVDVLWDGPPPATATHQVHKLIGRLRQRIPRSIDTDGRGYRFRPDAHSLDVDRFTALSAGADTPELAAALALWRGPALAGVDSLTLRAAAAALTAQRLAVEERLDQLLQADPDDFRAGHR
ncbi:MAG TPA: BTAD domain-containing putative transcriptional regulator [Mycobacteriales bacterium]|nr:BTAD domain-containing putative transcriptional regulator [Mycobacteriales bacterium]